MPLEAKFMGRAYGALKSELGRRACRQGWGVTLFEFIAEGGVWPDPEQQRQLQDRADAIAAAKADWPAVCRDAHDRRIARFERIANGLE